MSCGFCHSHDEDCEDDDTALMESIHLCELMTNPIWNHHGARKRCDRSVRHLGHLFKFAPRRMMLSDICTATCQQCDCVDDIEHLALQFGGCEGIISSINRITCDTEFEFLEEETPSTLNTSNSILLQKAEQTFGEGEVSPQHRRSFNLKDICANTCDNCPPHNPNCADDNKALAVYLGRCSGALERSGLNCESPLTDSSEFATDGYILEDFCPNRCGTCYNYPTSFPTLIPATLSPTKAPTKAPSAD
jgi:hypothetical protein